MTGYIEVAGLRTWHEVSGAGDPVVLLHGGFVGASSFFAQVRGLVEASPAIWGSPGISTGRQGVWHA